MYKYTLVIQAIQRYWNERIHDLEMTDAAVGSKAFFDDLDEYRFDKLHYLPRLVDFSGFRGERLLDYAIAKARGMGLKTLFVLSTRTTHWFIERGFAETETAWLPEKKAALYNYDRRSKVFVRTI